MFNVWKYCAPLRELRCHSRKSDAFFLICKAPIPPLVCPLAATMELSELETRCEQRHTHHQHSRPTVRGLQVRLPHAGPLRVLPPCVSPSCFRGCSFVHCYHSSIADPNYFGETAFWFSYALFTLSSSGGFPTAGGFTGALVLIANFHFSTDFGEVCDIPDLFYSTARVKPRICAFSSIPGHLLGEVQGVRVVSEEH